MRKLVLSIAISLAALTLGSCTPPEIQIALSGADGHVIATLTQDWGLIFSDKKPPCVDRIELHPIVRGVESREYAWLIEAKTDQCVTLNKFVVGVPVAGFKEVRSLPVAAKGNYRLVVWGIGVGLTELALR